MGHDDRDGRIRGQAVYRGLVLQRLGRAGGEAQLDSALAVLRGVSGPLVYAPGLHSAFAIVHAGSGRHDEAREFIARASERLRTAPVNASSAASLMNLAVAQTLTGDHDAAIATLELVLQRPAGITPAYLRIVPEFAPLRTHPRWRQLAPG